MSYTASGLGAIPSRLGQIRSKAGYVYQVTPDDLLWLARSVQFEGGDHASTMWAYAQIQAKRRRRGSLVGLVRAHSQPVNPLWESATTDKCRRYPDRCSPNALARRLQARTMPWDRIRSEVRNKVVAWATAELPNPVPRVDDFADDAVSRSFIRRNPGTQIVKRVPSRSGRTEQWYLATPATQGWPADFVTMHFGGRVAGPVAGGSVGAGRRFGVPLLGVAAVGVGVAFAGWAFWYSRR
jgi:hypothetical protein